MDDNKLTALLVKVIATVIIVFILSVGAFYTHKDYRTAKLIEKGIDPIAASLSMNDPMASEVTGYLLAKDAK